MIILLIVWSIGINYYICSALIAANNNKKLLDGWELTGVYIYACFWPIFKAFELVTTIFGMIPYVYDKMYKKNGRK